MTIPLMQSLTQWPFVDGRLAVTTSTTFLALLRHHLENAAFIVEYRSDEEKKQGEDIVFEIGVNSPRLHQKSSPGDRMSTKKLKGEWWSIFTDGGKGDDETKTKDRKEKTKTRVGWKSRRRKIWVKDETKMRLEGHSGLWGGEMTRRDEFESQDEMRRDESG